jgi:hypothetical protein
MSGIEVVVIECGPEAGWDGVVLEDVTVPTDWRGWLRVQLHIELDDVAPRPTAIPGVSLSASDAPVGAAANTAARRLVTGGDGYEWLMTGDPDPGFRGPAVAFGYTDAFGGDITRLTGSQRVAIEAAAFGEWEAFHRAVARIKPDSP